MLDWLVLADDRTGALEVAGAIAAAVGMPVAVVSCVGEVSCAEELAGVASLADVAPIVVIDVGTRHLTVDAASLRLAAVAPTAAGRRAYKLDSMLRGNWAADVVALAESGRARVVVAAAFPAMGRTCRGGVVHVHGDPLATSDARAMACSPAPAAHLRAAGVAAADIAELGDAEAVRRWAGSESGEPRVVVCDAGTDDDLAAIGEALAGVDLGEVDVLFAGTSASIAACIIAAAGAAVSERGVVGAHPPTTEPGTMPHVLVVCGSLHPMAVAQLARVQAARGLRDRADVAVIVGDSPAHLPVEPAAAEHAAAELGRRARAHLASRRVDAMIIVGGDTAAAVLDTAPRLVGGLVATGVPWSVALDGTGPVVVTKAGGFGRPDALVELIIDLTAAGAG